ncbi:MAG: hypothetical protein GY913_33440 [Proteobacteria bacterium]|nr:hypothetical protein [Pseudomonadota bacterium]MCP4921831.1 hypothetical protein [Pseudomonadota bacterium]
MTILLLFACTSPTDTGPTSGDSVVDSEPSSDTGDPCEPSTFFVDGDGDGFGSADQPVEHCEQPSGTVDNDQDCDDTNAAVNPDATEVCDGLNTSCASDWVSDEGTATFWEGGASADWSASLSGTEHEPLEHDLPDGELHVCGGTWFVALSTDDDLTLIGHEDAVLSGSDVGTVLEVLPGANVVVRDLTLSNGYGTIANVYDPGAGGGGAIWCETATVDLEGARLIDNEAHRRGAAVMAGDCELTLVDTEVARNVSANIGGAIQLDASTMDVVGGSFVDNEGYVGGAFYLTRGSTLSVNGGHFEGNIGAYGGAIAVEGRYDGEIDDVYLVDTTFVDNDGGGYGAAVYDYWHSGVLEIEGCSFEGSIADEGAALFLEDLASASLTTSSFSTNVAAEVGGALFVLGSNVTGTELDFSGNTPDDVYDADLGVGMTLGEGASLTCTAGAGCE